VTIVDGGSALGRCLRALSAQANSPPLEILVPCDDTVEGVDELVGGIADARVVRMGRVDTVRPATGFAGQHELYDRRRAAGLRAASGEFVAMLEDRSVPRPDWARRALEELGQGWAAVGGAIENAVDRPLNWAVYLCDFGPYRLPLTGGPTDRLSDVNVAYPRTALDAVRPTWERRYHEPEVHAALLESGAGLCLSPWMIVDQMRDGVRFRALLAERFHWARLYAARRAERLGGARRWLLAVGAPALPLVLLWRSCRLQLQKRRNTRSFLLALPAIAALLIAWSAGETAGYLTGRP